MMIRFYNYDDLLHMNCDHFHIAQGVSSDAVSWPKRVRIWAAPWYHFCQVRNSLIKMCFYSLLKTYFAAQQARHSSSHRQGRATQPQRARHRTQTPLHRWSSWSCWSCWSWSSWWLRCILVIIMVHTDPGPYPADGDIWFKSSRFKLPLFHHPGMESSFVLNQL